MPIRTYLGDQSAFNPEHINAMSKALEESCAALQVNGQTKDREIIAARIIDLARNGVIDATALGNRVVAETKAMRSLLTEVGKRFRLVPHFFVSTPDAPEVIEKLWDFARGAYLDNPIPTLFKEPLFVFLSRFCPVRYCLIRHCGFLVGYGHSSGDPTAPPQTIDQVIKLLTTPPPWRRPLDPIYESLEAIKQPFDWPTPDSDTEDWLFVAAALIFTEPAKSERARNSLRQVLGGKRFEYLLAFLAFVRTAHFWTLVHPGLELEDDVRQLVSRHQELGSLLLQDPEAVGS